ncbi:hypothetical protein SAMN05518672_106148 [Chitinophaga sp. CF118]|uniref:hypothetical protein n=1 Tax=Chitinophaga sp. CF118 TaxID=1884367 RepID=UPI0008ED8515|nr:hypothetical protein [Chitinophaga sp. CF118]SFE44522.1 hypothetical protein SAMN05518672_106148 [Chitinophaga sp. CF118]
MVQELKVAIKGKEYSLQVEPEKYNGHNIYYLLNDNISNLFDNAIPDNLMLIEDGNGFSTCPKLSEMEGRNIIQQIWEAIVKQK